MPPVTPAPDEELRSVVLGRVAAVCLRVSFASLSSIVSTIALVILSSQRCTRAKPLGVFAISAMIRVLQRSE